MNAIAYRLAGKHRNAPTFYVRELPGQGGVDWGYVTDPLKAVPLTPYWQRRFRADCERCGVTAQFLTIN